MASRSSLKVLSKSLYKFTETHRLGYTASKENFVLSLNKIKRKKQVFIRRIKEYMGN